MILIAGGTKDGFREPNKEEMKSILKWFSLSEKERKRLLLDKAERERVDLNETRRNQISRATHRFH